VREFTWPDFEEMAERSCPSCGGKAALHARFTRAIHDWETTFVECVRLRCCGRTFTSTPRGVTPGARYSDRVVGLVRLLVATGASRRTCARVLGDSGVPVTAQALAKWCQSTRKGERECARLSPEREGRVGVRLRDGLWLVFPKASPEKIGRLMERSRA